MCTKRDGNLSRYQLFCPQPLGSLVTSRLQTAFMQVTVVHSFVDIDESSDSSSKKCIEEFPKEILPPEPKRSQEIVE